MPKNVILILSDQLRADCVGCYGNEDAHTPNISWAAVSSLEDFRSSVEQCAGLRPQVQLFLALSLPRQFEVDQLEFLEARGSNPERFRGFRSLFRAFP